MLTLQLPRFVTSYKLLSFSNLQLPYVQREKINSAYLIQWWEKAKWDHEHKTLSVVPGTL